MSYPIGLWEPVNKPEEVQSYTKIPHEFSPLVIDSSTGLEDPEFCDVCWSNQADHVHEDPQANFLE